MKKSTKKYVLSGLLIIAFSLFVGGYYLITKRPTVSVILSTYNRATYLPKAIDSILSQTFQDFEFIIIDDGSIDKTQEVITAYQEKDPRIKVYKNKRNKGLVHNLNFGIKKARGKYIARMDDDDISLPTRFEKQVAFLKENPHITVLGTNRYAIGEDPFQRLFPWMSDPNEKSAAIETLFYTPAPHSTWMIRKSFLDEKHIQYNEKYKYAEDMKFLTDIIFAGGSIVSLPDILLGYDQRSPKQYRYRKTQYESRDRAIRNAFLHFFPKEEVDRLMKGTKCDKYKALWDLPDKKMIFDRETLKQKINRFCPTIHLD